MTTQQLLKTENRDVIDDFYERFVKTGFKIGNYYGTLSIASINMKYYWSIENYDGDYWKEIPQSLFIELLKLIDDEPNY